MADAPTTGPSWRERLLVRAFTTFHGPLMTGLRWLGDPIGILEDRRALVADPYAVYDRIRAQGTVVPSRLRVVWVAAGHAAVRETLREHRVQPEHAQLRWDSPLDPSLLSLDPPDHTRIRRLVAQAFTPRAVSGMRRRAEEVAHGLLDDAARRGGPVDLMRDFASPLPITMICAMLGLPADDMDAFRDWGEAVALSLEVPDPANQPRIEAAGRELERVFTAEFARRREDPSDDLLTALVQASDGGDRLSEQELVATSILILLAGFETTVNLIGNGVLALLRHPEQRDLLAADPAGVAPGAVEELLRYDSPVQLTSRFTAADAVIDGVEVPAGTDVVCLLGAANRDPEVFTDPDALDLTRGNAREHLSFSTGVHHCLGASLARLEGEVALTALFGRFPKLRQVAPARRRQAQVLRGLETFPVDLGPPA